MKAYADFLDRLIAKHPESRDDLLELDCLVGDYLVEGTEQGRREGLAGLGFMGRDSGAVVAKGDSLSVRELVEAAGLDATLSIALDGYRIPVDRAIFDGSARTGPWAVLHHDGTDGRQ